MQTCIPNYNSIKANATGELHNISYRNYLNLKGYDLRKWCKPYKYAPVSYNYPLGNYLSESISSQWYKNYAASYRFTLDDRLVEYDYSGTQMKSIPNTYSNITNMFHNIANTYLVGVTTVTSQTDSWVRYGYSDTSIDGWKAVISNGLNHTCDQRTGNGYSG